MFISIQRVVGLTTRLRDERKYAIYPIPALKGWPLALIALMTSDAFFLNEKSTLKLLHRHFLLFKLCIAWQFLLVKVVGR